MKILKESKENLPVSFLTDFISKGWEEVGYLKANIESIKEAFKGTKKVEELLQALIDAYLVCIGQLEAHINDKNYIEYPEESGLLKEDLEIKISDEVVEIKPEDTVTAYSYDEAENKIILTTEESKDEDEIEDVEVEEKEEPKVESEPFEYFVDFDEPDMSEPALTDDDIYGKR